MHSSGKLRAIHVTINLETNTHGAEVQDLVIKRTTQKQYKVPSVSTGGYRNIVLKTELNKILNLKLNDSSIDYVIFIQCVTDEKKLQEQTEVIIKSTLTHLKKAIETRIEKSKSIVNYINNTLEDFKLTPKKED